MVSSLEHGLHEYDARGTGTKLLRYRYDKRFDKGQEFPQMHPEQQMDPFNPEWKADVTEHDSFAAVERARQAQIGHVGQLQDVADRLAGFPARRYPLASLRRTRSASGVPSLRHALHYADVEREGEVALSLEQESFERNRVATAKDIIRDNPRIPDQHRQLQWGGLQATGMKRTLGPRRSARHSTEVALAQRRTESR